MDNGVSTVSGRAKSRDVRSDAQMPAPILNEQGFYFDLQTWVIDSTAVRAARASFGVGKKGLTSLPFTL